MTTPASGTRTDEHGEDVFADATATWELLEQVRQRVRELNAARFQGEDPVVRPKGRGGPREVAVATLAAERLHGLLQLKDVIVSPAEDLANAELDAGLRALSTWDLRRATWHLAAATRAARLPETQQRISLARELALVLSVLLDASLISPPDQSVMQAVQRRFTTALEAFDRLPEDERAFYQREVQRLLKRWEHVSVEAGRDAVSIAWVAWMLFQARLAIRDGAQLDALALLLQLVQRHRDALHNSDNATYIAGLVERGRQQILRVVGMVEHASGDDAQSGQRGDTSVKPNELYTALLVLLSQYYEHDLTGEMNQFMLSLYPHGDLGRWAQEE